MNNNSDEIFFELLDSFSSDDSDEIFEQFFKNSLSSDDSAADDENSDDTSSFIKTIEKYSDAEFKLNLRINRSTVEQLITNYSVSEISPNQNSKHGGKPKIDARRQVYLYVWYISNTMSFRQLGVLFGVAQSSAWNAVNRVSSWLISKGNKYIKWPQGDAVAETCRKFEAETKIPQVIGVIGCTHITIAAPRRNKNSYRSCRMKFQKFSLVLQAVVDADKKFIDICCGEPGSLNDSHVLRRSSLYKMAFTHYNRLFPANTFLLGNTPYTPVKWIVPPFNEDYQLTIQKRSFNNLHSNGKKIVEDAFDLLKGRFRKLNEFTEQRNQSSIKKIIASACIMHNICIMNNDQYTDILEISAVDSTEDTANLKKRFPYNRRQQILFSDLCKKNII